MFCFIFRTVLRLTLFFNFGACKCEPFYHASLKMEKMKKRNEKIYEVTLLCILFIQTMKFNILVYAKTELKLRRMKRMKKKKNADATNLFCYAVTFYHHTDKIYGRRNNP